MLGGGALHELSIAMSIFEAVEKEATKRPDAKFLSVGLRIGELTAIDKDSLEFGWEAITRETRLHDLKLAIETIARQQKCPLCDVVFHAVDFETQCPKCGNPATTTVSGDELDIAYIEVDES
jgi:hydrogenase nickel incorporation protein HypA/HybF